MDDRERMHALLQTVPGLYDQMMALGAAGPAPGSPAMSDATDEIGQLVRSGAVTALTNALDHLLAWATLYVRAATLPTYAHMTLMRSGVEGASTARWLVDPEVTRPARIARALGVQLADLAERGRLERAIVQAEPGARSPKMPAADRIREIESLAVAAQIVPAQVNHTDIVSSHGPGAIPYRILCSFAHAGQAVTLAASRRDTASVKDADGLRQVRLVADDGGALVMTVASIDVVKRALGDVARYHGIALPGRPRGQ